VLDKGHPGVFSSADRTYPGPQVRVLAKAAPLVGGPGWAGVPPPVPGGTGGVALGLRVGDQVAVAHWVVPDGEFEHAVGTRQSTSGSARPPEAAARPRPQASPVS
jgi:hypothetical protein